MIYHITTREIWEDALSKGKYEVISLAKEGYIHCSFENQFLETANLYFSNQPHLILLCIKVKKVKAEIINEKPLTKENNRSIQEFPHIYGSINLDAIIDIKTFICNKYGQYEDPLNV